MMLMDQIAATKRLWIKIGDRGINDLYPPSLKEKIPSIVYSLSPTIRHKIFNYVDTVKSIKVSNLETYGTGIAS